MVDIGTMGIGFRPDHEFLAADQSIYGGRTKDATVPHFRFSLNVKRAVTKLREVGEATSILTMRVEVQKLMDRMVELLKRITPGPGSDPRRYKGFALKDMWRVATDNVPGASTTLRYRVENTTKFRPLLRWLEQGTQGRGKSVITPGKNRILPNEMLTPKLGKATYAKWARVGIKTGWKRLMIPRSAWPQGNAKYTYLNGNPFFIFKEVRRVGIKGAFFFRRALREFESGVDDIRESLRQRVRQAASKV